MEDTLLQKRAMEDTLLLALRHPEVYADIAHPTLP